MQIPIRPITDIWILARARLAGGVKYYGAYPGGFPERARALLGVPLTAPLLHVCGGMARRYPYRRGFGPHDATLDLDPETDPTFLQDARAPLPSCPKSPAGLWPGILIDPPYSESDASHYRPGPDLYPSPTLLVRNALHAVPAGGRVGLLHYLLPAPPSGTIFVALIGVICGYNNRMRSFSVFEKPLATPGPSGIQKINFSQK